LPHFVWIGNECISNHSARGSGGRVNTNIFPPCAFIATPMGSRHDELIVYLATKRAVLLAGSCQCPGSSAVMFGRIFSLIAFNV
jgi:hypothetical protein